MGYIVESFYNAANKDNITVSDWLTAFLTDKMTEKDPDQIKESVNTIISTIDSLTAIRNDMNSAVKAGKTAEGWFADTILSQKHENNYVARLIAKMREGFEALHSARTQNPQRVAQLHCKTAAFAK